MEKMTPVLYCAVTQLTAHNNLYLPSVAGSKGAIIIKTYTTTASETGRRRWEEEGVGGCDDLAFVTLRNGMGIEWHPVRNQHNDHHNE